MFITIKFLKDKINGINIMKNKIIVAEITMGENYSLNLRAKNMNELVDKIIEWQTWENNVEALPKKVQKNWYFFKKKRKKIK